MEITDKQIKSFNIQLKNIISMCKEIISSAQQEFDDIEDKKVYKVNKYVDSEFKQITVEDHLKFINKELGVYKKSSNIAIKMFTQKDNSQDITNNHIGLFKDIYYKHLNTIIINDEDEEEIELDDSWICENNIVIWYGMTQDKKMKDKKGYGYVIRLSDIYNYTKLLENYFEDDPQAAENEYGDYMLYYIYKIFKIFSNKKDGKILDIYINELMDDLGLQTNNSYGSMIEKITGALSDNSLDNMIDLAGDIMPNLKMFKDKNIDPKDFKEHIKNNFARDDARDLLTSMKDLLGSDGTPSIDKDKIPDKFNDFMGKFIPKEVQTDNNYDDNSENDKDEYLENDKDEYSENDKDEYLENDKDEYSD